MDWDNIKTNIKNNVQGRGLDSCGLGEGSLLICYEYRVEYGFV
jgi:hypothetical protein